MRVKQVATPAQLHDDVDVLQGGIKTWVRVNSNHNSYFKSTIDFQSAMRVKQIAARAQLHDHVNLPEPHSGGPEGDNQAGDFGKRIISPF